MSKTAIGRANPIARAKAAIETAEDSVDTAVRTGNWRTIERAYARLERAGEEFFLALKRAKP